MPKYYPFKTLLLIFVLCSCGVSKKPPRKVKFLATLSEASGLSFASDRQTAELHNDSGDGPIVYTVRTETGDITEKTTLNARASDWEDICRDASGRLYLGDFGNNLGHRLDQTIYRYDPVTKTTDSITYVYPGQLGAGRLSGKDFDCEAVVHYHDHLHLFTKALPGRRKEYWAYHFTLPDEPGNYTATLIDSLYLPRRIITGAALDTVTEELALITYNYKRWLGFLPVVASSLITLKGFPEDRFFRGRLKRRNVSWGLPVQYEAIDFYDDKYLYIVSEKTIGRRSAFMKRKQRR